MKHFTSRRQNEHGRPTIGITMGCPVGIGPEIILKYYQDAGGNGSCNWIVIGDRSVLEGTAASLNTDIRCYSWKPGQALKKSGIAVYEVSTLAFDTLRWGQPTAETGKAMATAIIEAVGLCRQGHLAAMVTCPISKMALQQAGYRYPGHTEMLADLTGDDSFTMMMAGPKLRLTLVTIHCAFKDILAQMDTAAILQRIELTHFSLLKDFALHRPKIAIAGINPHAGENGVIGSEEETVIAPAVEAARQLGIDAQGPFPADTVFLKAAAGRFDAVVCMYHDQGLIPFKLLHFSDGVNVTIGLSIVRTSVDHGTAYDIAGQGTASAESLSAAVSLAAEIAANRATNEAGR